jgi:hypothetical protein
MMNPHPKTNARLAEILLQIEELAEQASQIIDDESLCFGRQSGRKESHVAIAVLMSHCDAEGESKMRQIVSANLTDRLLFGCAILKGAPSKLEITSAVAFLDNLSLSFAEAMHIDEMLSTVLGADLADRKSD